MLADLPILRALKPSDAAATLEAFQSDSSMSRQGTVRNLDEARGYVQALIDDELTLPLAICTPGNELAGLVALALDTANKVGWLWYWINANHRGHGWAAAGAASLANYALSAGGLERLELAHRVTNPRSGFVAHRAGFIREGLQRGKFLIDGQRIDVITYGRLITDPWPLTPVDARW